MKIEQRKKTFEPVMVTFETSEQLAWLAAAVNFSVVCPDDVLDEKEAVELRKAIRDIIGNDLINKYNERFKNL